MNGTGQGNGFATIVGANIRRARLDARLKQRELAVKLDMSSQHLSDWERGSYRPSDGNLLRLCDVFSKELAWFFIDHSDDDQVAA